VYVVTLPTTTAGDVAIKLGFIDGSLININYTFEYRSNPVLDDIRPRNHLTV